MFAKGLSPMERRMVCVPLRPHQPEKLYIDGAPNQLFFSYNELGEG